MLRTTLNELRGSRVTALDGGIGALEDLYVERRGWKVRYLVVGTGGWLTGRRVLLPAASVPRTAFSATDIPVAITQEQARVGEEARPDLRAQRSYWEGPVSLQMSPADFPAPFGMEHPAAEGAPRRTDGLLSARELVGYQVFGRDGAFGEVGDLVVDERGWSIAGLIVRGGAWLRRRAVLLSPETIEGIDRERAALRVCS